MKTFTTLLILFAAHYLHAQLAIGAQGTYNIFYNAEVNGMSYGPSLAYMPEEKHLSASVSLDFIKHVEIGSESQYAGGDNSVQFTKTHKAKRLICAANYFFLGDNQRGGAYLHLGLGVIRINHSIMPVGQTDPGNQNIIGVQTLYNALQFQPGIGFDIRVGPVISVFAEGVFTWQPFTASTAPMKTNMSMYGANAGVRFLLVKQ